MNRLELRTLMLSWLDDANAGYFTEPQCNVFLNNAQKTVQKRLIKAGQNYYTICVSTTLVVGQYSYVLPLNFKKLHRLSIVQGVSPNATETPLAFITTNQKDFFPTGTGFPRAYTIRRNRLYLATAPDSTYTMKMIYSYEVPDMTLDTDQPDVPPSYHELIALHAAEDGFLKDGRVSDLLQKKLKEYEVQLDIDAADRNQDTSRNVVETGDYVSGEFIY